MRGQKLGKGLGMILLTSLVACGDPEIVVPDVLSVDFHPPHGSVDISVDVQGLLFFTHPVADPAVAASGISLECLGTPNPTCASPISGCSTSARVTFEPGNFEARVVPNASLQSNTCYVFKVAGGIEALDEHVGALPSERRSAFNTQ
jgi:hypothetical protein